MPLLYFILLFFHYLSITLSQRKRDKTEKRNAGYANYNLISSDMTNAFNQITQAAILETVTLQFGLGVHASVQEVPRPRPPGRARRPARREPGRLAARGSDPPADGRHLSPKPAAYV